jgi:prefoldin subunit 5
MAKIDSTIGQIIDDMEQIREKLFTLQNALQKIESANATLSGTKKTGKSK